MLQSRLIGYLIFSNIKDLFYHVQAGCPCPFFDCSILDELAQSCKDLTENENYQFCFEEQKKVLVECLNNCKVIDCNTDCYDSFNADLQKCPCAQECPCEWLFMHQFIFLLAFYWKLKSLTFFQDDCPCENYDCDSIKRTNTSILILYSEFNYYKDQYILNNDGSKLLIQKYPISWTIIF